MDNIAQAKTDEDLAVATALFREYEQWLGLDLCFQDFERELDDLAGRYFPPRGRLLLVRGSPGVVGCIAMRDLGDGVCEMKRLYLREEGRGKGLGKRLVDRLIDEARDAGYRSMRLDTLPEKMGSAVALYRSRGFREIPPYYHNPYPGVLFMELTL
jgi:putative acetyltransferase